MAKLDLKVRAGHARLNTPVKGGYASDLLSCVMAGARQGYIWVTLQAHPNVVAVAVLLDLAGIIITEGVEPDAGTLQKAEQEDIPVLTTRDSTFTTVSKLAALGITGTGE